MNKLKTWFEKISAVKFVVGAIVTPTEVQILIPGSVDVLHCTVKGINATDWILVANQLDLT